MENMMLPIRRGLMKTQIRFLKANVEHIENATVEQIKEKLDITGDERVTRIEFLSKLEKPLYLFMKLVGESLEILSWFEQEMVSSMQKCNYFHEFFVLSFLKKVKKVVFL